MRIVQPYARLLPPPHVDLAENPDAEFTLEHGIQLLRRVEWEARISHRTEEKQTKESYERFLQTWVMEHGDFSTIEHCGVNIDFLVDRGLSHELVRHRIAAITQESTRFCNYGKKDGSIDVVLPPVLVPVHEAMKHIPLEYHNIYSAQEMVEILIHRKVVISDVVLASKLVNWYRSWIKGGLDSENRYLEQLRMGIAPEEARDELPHKLAVRMGMTHNLRNLRHILIMRTTNETHRKLRPLMQQLLIEIKAKIPILFSDLEPDVKQSTNMKRMR